ncbi:mpv17-like protein isoform X3 [Anopheles moucheti]|nr:mpv17-like protein isoform X3 [Anopheles moucheti]
MNALVFEFPPSNRAIHCSPLLANHFRTNEDQGCLRVAFARRRYKWLDKTFPGTAKRIIVRKLLLDQFVLTPPLLVIFFTGMSLMEQQSSITEECRQKFVPTFARSCLFWIPAQTLNFVLVPPKFRVVYVGSCAFAWVNILCWVKRQKMLSSN